MASSPDAPGEDPYAITGIRAISEPGQGLAAQPDLISASTPNIPAGE